MKHSKILCHSNKKSYLSCWQNQTMKKRIQLTGARREYLYTHIKSHWKTPDPSTISRKSSGTNIPHTNICQCWRNVIWRSVHTCLHSHHMSPKEIFHSHSLCMPRFPAGPCLFSGEKDQIYINHSDLTDGTGHWIENRGLKYLKRFFVFKQSETDKEKVHALVCVDECAQNF